MPIQANVTNNQITASVGETQIDVSVSGGVGPTGTSGAAATVTVGTVTTGAPGSSASVVNAGTSSAAVLNFTIPAGATGATGPQGATGAPGTAATVTVGTVTTGTAGSSATVTNSGTSGAAVLNFTIPAGATGATGPQGPQGPAGSNATATTDASALVTGTLNAARLPSTTVTAGSYGSASSVGTFTVDAAGRLTVAGSTAIAISAGAVSGLANVATSGSYNDLTNKPTIPSAYTLPTASATVLGGVKIGSGLAIDGSSVLSTTYSYTLPNATTSTLGGVIVGTGLSVTSGTVSANVTSVAGRTGAITLSSADVSGLAASATTDTTNASNISSGTLAAARLPSSGVSASSLTTGTLPYGRVGSYLRGYAGFADADDWASRVTTNGGSVSSTTMDAVYRFCQAIQAQGIRSLLWRVNLFCGTGLASALVPLYRGPSLSGTQYGNTTDTNGGNNFAAGNYTETGATGGLVGNGTSRYLDTGLKPATVGTSAHLSCHVTSGGTKSNMFMLGCDNAFDSGWTTHSLDYGSSSIARGTVSNGAGVVSDNSMGTAYSVCVSSLRSTGAMQTIYFNGGMAGRPWNAANGVNNPTFQTQPDWSIYVFASNRKGTAVAYGNDTIAAYSIGLHMQAAAVAAHYQALAAFMTDLGRNI